LAHIHCKKLATGSVVTQTALDSQ